MTAVSPSVQRHEQENNGRTPNSLFRQLTTLATVPRPILIAAVVTSYATLVVSSVAGWPLWAKVLAALLPWAPVVGTETAWIYSHYRWLALFYVLVITQSGHVLEHLSQVTQIHVFHRHGADARGVFGALDIEWVHFGWNTWVLIALVLLAFRYRRNGWLWMAVTIAAWHELEHAYILSTYLRTGEAGTPGLLSAGGIVGGGLFLQRPDLHFLYNLLETVPLIGAFLFQLRRCHAIEPVPAGAKSHDVTEWNKDLADNGNSNQSRTSRGEAMTETRIDHARHSGSAPPPVGATSRGKSRRLLAAIVGLAVIGVAVLVAISPEESDTVRVAKAPTPAGYSQYLVFTANSTLGSPEEMMVSGDVFHRGVMGRTDEQITENKAQAIAFYKERFGLDFSQSDTIDGVSLMGFTLSPKVNYRAHTISGQSVPDSGWEVRDGGWVAMVGRGGTTLYGAYGGPSGKTAPEGAMIPFGEYSIKAIDEKGKRDPNPIVLQYQAFGPMVFAADGTSVIECELVSPQLGRGTALGYMKLAPLASGGVGMTVRNVLTFPAS